MKKRKIAVALILFSAAAAWLGYRLRLAGGDARPDAATRSSAGIPVFVGPEGKLEELRAPAAPTPQVGAKPDPTWVTQFAPRAADEWQGMPVDVGLRQVCWRSSFCGRALACIDNVCGPCRTDAQCDTGEICVLGDYCLQRARAGCRSRADCARPSELCIIEFTDEAGGPRRGNENLRSSCKDASG
jgi:hypothetical protein